MDLAHKFVCPVCSTPLKSERGVQVGWTIQCPKCGAPFPVRPGDAGSPGEVNGRRLALVVCGAALYVLGGAALASYCVWRNARKPEPGPPPAVAGARAEDGRAAEPPPRPPLPPPSGDPVEQRKIDDAIVKGVWYLKDHQLESGSWSEGVLAPSYAGLAGLTLLECGVPGSDRHVRKAATLVREQIPFLPTSPAARDTYQLAVAILFLDRLSADNEEGAALERVAGKPGADVQPPAERPDDRLIQYLALCLIAGQNPVEGYWHYKCPLLDRGRVPELLRLLRDDRESLDDWRTAALGGRPLRQPNWDNSNTQFAVLGLWAARRHGVPIGRSIALAEWHFRSTQMGPGEDPTGHNLNLAGSWYYDPLGPRGWRNSSAWPSMTCAGLLGLAAAHSLDGEGTAAEGKPLADPQVQRALAMLGREIDRPDEARPPDLYFLWSLERVGVLFNLAKIEDKDWYAWGAKALLARQAHDGSWAGSSYFGSNPIVDTCFALLFLKQANLAKDLTAKLQLLAEPK